MIFKRFFTWFCWSWQSDNFIRILLMLLAFFFLPLVFFMWSLSQRHWWISCMLMGYILFLFISIPFALSRRNWRIAIDKAEKKVKEIGEISDKFQDVFTKIKDQVRKSQNPDKLIEFINLLTQLKAEDTMMAIGSEIRIREIRQRIFKLAKED